MRNVKSFIVGGAIGILGGLIGLGGAEFRLPLLVSLFGFASLNAVMINKMSSLLVVAFSLPFRSQSVPWHTVHEHFGIVLNILSGSLVGAWIGAHYATKIKTVLLDKLIMMILVGLAFGMIFGHSFVDGGQIQIVQEGVFQAICGAVAGIVIGVVAAILGVAGGELIIPTLVLLFGVDIKLAGSLSLCISLPTMVVAFCRYTQSGAIELLKKEKAFLIWMALGSIVGSAMGGKLIGIIPSNLLVFSLGGILLISAVKTFKHSLKQRS